MGWRLSLQRKVVQPLLGELAKSGPNYSHAAQNHFFQINTRIYSQLRLLTRRLLRDFNVGLRFESFLVNIYDKA